MMEPISPDPRDAKNVRRQIAVETPLGMFVGEETRSENGGLHMRGRLVKRTARVLDRTSAVASIAAAFGKHGFERDEAEMIAESIVRDELGPA
jgi:hypothetical protein